MTLPFETIIFPDPSHAHLKARYPLQPAGNEKLAMIINGEIIQEEFPNILESLNQCSGVILVDGGANLFCKLYAEALNSGLSIKPQPLCLVGDLDSVTAELIAEIRKKYPAIETVKFNCEKNFTDLEGALQLIKMDVMDQVLIFNALGNRIDQALGNLLYLFRPQYQGKVHISTPKEQVAVFKQPPPAKLKWTKIPFYIDRNGQELYLASNIPGEINFSFPESGKYYYEFNRQGLLKDLNLLRHCTQHPETFFIHTQFEHIFAVTPTHPFTCKASIGQTISLIPFGGPVLEVSTRGLRWILSNATLDQNFIGISNVASAHEICVSVKKGNLLCIVNSV